MGGIFGKGSTITNSETKIGALQIQQSTYGVPIPVIFGTNRVAGNLLDYIDFKAIPHTTTQTSGGKGGGKVTQSNTTYTYTVMLIIGLCEGGIAGIGQIWNDKSIVELASLGLSLFTGAPGQSPWSEMQSKHSERALNYPKTAYVAAPVFDLGSSANLPNLTFEVKGRNLFSGSLDANPKDIIIAILSDPQIGVGFPAQYIADLTQFSNYCIANKVLFSPAFASQDEAHAPITTLCQAANSEPVWSQGKLKIVPYSLESITANGVTYTPPPSPIYDLTIDDFVYEEGEPPVKVKPNLTADRYNIQPVEIMNRTNDYNIEPIKATDDTNIGDVGPRPADSIEMHFITDPDVGQFAAQSILQRQLYVPKQYEFTLTWRHCLLDSMDVVTITELDFLGLFKEPVRIVEIKEDESFNLAVTAEDCPEGVHSPALYSTQLATRPTPNYNIDPGNINPPVILQAPDVLTTSGLEVWVAASGNELWGSCNVWISEDGETFKRIGNIDNPSRQGVLSEALSMGADPDIVNTLSVDMSLSRSELYSGTSLDVDNLNNLCYVDGEFISFETATLTESNKYSLSYLRRGTYSSDIAFHGVGSQFVRIDEALFKYPFTPDKIGRTIYFKFTSKNIYGGGEQQLEDVEVFSHVLSDVYVPQVTDLKLVQHLREVRDGTNLYELEASWNPPSTTLYNYGDVYLKSSQPNWDELDMSWDEVGDSIFADMTHADIWKYIGNAHDKITIPGCATGQSFTVKVVASTQQNFKADFDMAPTVSHEIKIKSYTPATPQNLSVVFTSVCTWSWDDVGDTDNDFYELRLDKSYGDVYNRIARTNANKIAAQPPSRQGTVYLYAHNSSNQYSPAAPLEFNKPAPIAPQNITVADIFQGIVITCDSLPAYCLGINVHVNDGTGDKVYFSPNNNYTFKSTGGIYDIQIAYVDLFGEGSKSTSITKTVKPTIDPALIAAESLSLAMMDGIIKDAVVKAQDAATQLSVEAVKDSLEDAQSDITAAKTRISAVEGVTTTNSASISTLTNQVALKANKDTVDALTGRVTTTEGTVITQAGQIALKANQTIVDTIAYRVTTAEGSITTQAGQIALKANQTTVDTLSNTVTANKASVDVNINAITQTVTSNKTTQDGINTGVANQITQQANQTTSIITELNKPIDQSNYTSFVQALQAINLRVTSVTFNSAMQPNQLVTQINLANGVITLDGKLVHITGNTVIDANVIASGMIQAGAIQATHIAAGAITADKINVTSLSALSATIGTLRTATTGARTEISDNLIRVYDSNNVLRVRMGVW